ncbi:MAG: hypothetical protein ACI8RZ_000954 [Myxococcota bacterium]|jgi:hypothetical protein
MVELLDPSIAEGVPIEGTCRLCRHQVAFGEVTTQGQRFVTVEAARAALLVWAAAEGEPNLDSFCEGSLCGISPTEACRRLVAGESIETSFDVLALLFPGMGGGMGSAGPTSAKFTPTRSMIDVPEPLPEVPRTSPRIVARAMAAVMLADGEINPRERTFLDAWLANHGHAPLTDDDLRPWRPGDLGWLEEPAPVVEAMVALAYVDRQRDGTEWRVIREFSRYWRYPLSELEAMGRLKDAETASMGKRLWTVFASIFVRSE